MQVALGQVVLRSVSVRAMSTLRSRLESAMEGTSPPATQAALAKACRISTAAVAGWFQKDSWALQATHCFAIAKLLGVDAEWLATGHGQMVASRRKSTFELSEGDPGLLDAYHRLPEQAKLPVRALIESLTVAFDPTYHAYIETVIEHQNNHRAAKSPREKT